MVVNRLFLWALISIVLPTGAMHQGVRPISCLIAAGVQARLSTSGRSSSDSRFFASNMFKHLGLAYGKRLSGNKRLVQEHVNGLTLVKAVQLGDLHSANLLIRQGAKLLDEGDLRVLFHRARWGFFERLEICLDLQGLGYTTWSSLMALAVMPPSLDLSALGKMEPVFKLKD